MPTKTQLSPVSLHLRNFNKYTRLDLPASQNGNLTLIGQNAVGKTTLANCFFPMLIDGSIATPSFNPVRDTDKLNQSGNPRNSAQDDHTFDSMLLSWGSGAMKVRTGYAYMRLQSPTRQVILGIGATRTSGSSSKPTWWFLVVSSDVRTPLNLKTTDENGKSLDKKAFEAANQDLGAELQLFDSALHYRAGVATQVYGFDSGARLGKLAAAYRLLASPILTGGNGKFTPIIEALKNAQAGIDQQVISDVADSQRGVNATNALLARLKQVQNRLKRIKTAVFWRNLNRLQERHLNAYSQLHTSLDKQETQRDNLQRTIERCDQELTTVQTNLATMTQRVNQLQLEVLQQQEIEDKRQSLTTAIQDLERRLSRYQTQLAKLATIKQTIQELQAARKAAEQQCKTIMTTLSPLRARLVQHTGELSELRQVVMSAELAELAAVLAQYLRQQRERQKRYQAMAKQITQGRRDVQIVAEMKTQLDGCIDERAQGPLSARFRDGLHADNQTVHDAGSAKMDQAVAAILEKQQQLLAKHPDVKAFNADETLRATLTTLQHQLDEQLTALADQQRLIKDRDQQLAAQTVRATDLEQDLEPNFDVEATQTQIKTQRAQLAQLKLDPELPAKFKAAQHAQTKLTQSVQDLQRKSSNAAGELKTVRAVITEDQERLADRTDQINQALTTLHPYVPATQDLTTVAAVLSFVHANQAEVRNADYSGLVDYVGKQIHHNDQNGIDRNAIDQIFEERGHTQEASEMRQQRTVNENDMTVVAFDINHAQQLVTADITHVERKLAQLEKGNELAQVTYMTAAAERIEQQYHLIDDYNAILNQGKGATQQIKLKITLTPATVSDVVIADARNTGDTERKALRAEVNRRLNKLANDVDVADDEEAFMAEANRLLDTRQWSAFQVYIKRRQNGQVVCADDR